MTISESGRFRVIRDSPRLELGAFLHSQSQKVPGTDLTRSLDVRTDWGPLFEPVAITKAGSASVDGRADPSREDQIARAGGAKIGAGRASN